MIISGRRIRNLGKHLRPVVRGSIIIIGLRVISRFEDVFFKMGFTAEPGVGETVLPSAKFGPVSAFNAEGKYQVHRDQPKETAYSQVLWHWEEWHGPYDRVSQSRIVDRPYERYPRTFIPPPSVEFTITSDLKNNRIVTTSPLEYSEQNEDKLLHTINLFLEIFGECEVLTEELGQIIQAPIRKVNWHILPPGRRPWDQLREDIAPIVAEAPEGNQPVIHHRLESINSYGPRFVAIGRGGFRGYVIFGFPENNNYVLESLYYGNATYIFGEQWEELSKLTKAQILSGNLQTARIIHRKGWLRQVDELLSK